MKEEAKYHLPKRKDPKTKQYKYVLEGENKDMFIKLYPTTFNEEMMQIFGIGFVTVRKLGRKLNLKKDLQSIRKRVGLKTSATMRESSYTASLKGHVPEHLKSYVQKMKDGTIATPLERFKAKCSDEQLRAFTQRMSEAMSKVIREERVRIKYGLPQKTRFHLLDDAEKRAAKQKRTMIYECNYFADPAHPNWVCYDKDTKRSAVREATAIRRGLEIVEGE